MTKDGLRTIVLKMDPQLFDQISEYCDEAGQTKKMALTRIIRNYLDHYYDQDKETRKPL